MVRFGQVPLCSSDQIISALQRIGCYQGKARGSSHVVFHRRHDSDGRILTAPVVVGKKEVPRGTLRSILMLLDISLDDFLAALR